MSNYKDLYMQLISLERDKVSRTKRVTSKPATFDKSKLKIGQVLGLTHNIANVVTPKHHCYKCHNVWYEDTTIRIKVHQVCPYCGHVWYM